MAESTNVAESTSVSGFRRVLSVASMALMLFVVIGSVALTDDFWPAAPFRMFSYGNNPNGVVRTMTLHVDMGDGTETFIGAGSVGLRRAEIEEQTPWNRQVTAERMADLATAYDVTHDGHLLRLQVVVQTQQMSDGAPDGDVIESVIGEWNAPDSEFEPTEINLPLAEPWTGYDS